MVLPKEVYLYQKVMTENTLIICSTFNMAVNLTFMAWLVVVLYMLIADESILFPVAVKHIFALSIYNKILKLF